MDPNGDTHSLLVTNRTAGYMGPSLNLLSVPNVVAGATYQVTAYVLLAAPDSSNPDRRRFDQDGGLRDVGRVRQHRDFGGAVEYGVDEGAGHIQLQQSAGAADEPDALYPVQQRDGFVLYRATW